MQKIETKVIAAGAGAGLGGALGKFLLWWMGTQLWNVPTDAAHDAQATAAVPSSVSGLVIVLLAVAGAAISGYVAPHTPRPGDASVPFEQRYEPVDLALSSGPYLSGQLVDTGAPAPQPDPDPEPADSGAASTDNP